MSRSNTAATNPAVNPTIAEPSFTIAEFCLAERITQPTYYKLKKMGLAPREMRFGNVVRITHQARLDWHRARENPTGAEAEAIAATAQTLRERSQAAVKRSIKSPNHVSKRAHRAGSRG